MALCTWPPFSRWTNCPTTGRFVSVVFHLFSKLNFFCLHLLNRQKCFSASAIVTGPNLLASHNQSSITCFFVHTADFCIDEDVDEKHRNKTADNGATFYGSYAVWAKTVSAPQWADLWQVTSSWCVGGAVPLCQFQGWPLLKAKGLIVPLTKAAHSARCLSVPKGTMASWASSVECHLTVHLQRCSYF